MSTQSPRPSSSVFDPAEDLRASHWVDTLKNGTGILIRALEIKDRQREFEFIKSLSPESRHFRFLSALNEPGEHLLDQMLDIDYRQRMAYVALSMEGDLLTEVGVARYAATQTNAECESAIVVADQWQRKGVGTRLMQHLTDAARINGFERMMSMDAATNLPMRHFAKALDFASRQDPQDSTQVIYTRELN